jgi:hypothetical protein
MRRVRGQREVTLATQGPHGCGDLRVADPDGCRGAAVGADRDGGEGRTTKARYTGIEPVWFSDSRPNPRWFGHVPGVVMNPEVPWDMVPGQRSVTVVSGVRVLVPRRYQDIRCRPCHQRDMNARRLANYPLPTR